MVAVYFSPIPLGHQESYLFGNRNLEGDHMAGDEKTPAASLLLTYPHSHNDKLLY
jgi:hypothetical protein